MSWFLWYLVIGAVFTIGRMVVALASSQYARSRGIRADVGMSYLGNASLPFVVFSLVVELVIWPLVAAWTVVVFAKVVVTLASRVLTMRKLRRAE